MDCAFPVGRGKRGAPALRDHSEHRDPASRVQRAEGDSRPGVSLTRPSTPSVEPVRPFESANLNFANFLTSSDRSKFAEG